MKAIVIILLCSITHVSICQTIVKNEVDDFTGISIKETSFEPIHRSMKGNVFASIKVQEGIHYLSIKYMPYIGIIEEDSELMLKLSNDTVLKLRAAQDYRSCTGCGAKGFGGSQASGINADYYLSEQDLEVLNKYPVTKLRIYGMDGYKELTVNKKLTDNISSLLAIL